MDTVIYRCWI